MIVFHEPDATTGWINSEVNCQNCFDLGLDSLGPWKYIYSLKLNLGRLWYKPPVMARQQKRSAFFLFYPAFPLFSGTPLMGGCTR